MRHLLLLTTVLLALPAHSVDIDWVAVAGSATPNDCDPQPDFRCFGSVAGIYFIGKYEVTNAQYAEFLNAVAETDTYGLYNENMSSVPDLGGIARSGSPGDHTYSAIAGREAMPVNYVSFYDALRFANWLHNGLPTGAQDASTTEDGAYTIVVEDYLSGPVIFRNPGAAVFLPSEDEWHKAAYYAAGSASYFDYPAGADEQTVCALPVATPNTANCREIVDDLTDVGSYTGSDSPSGTFDQGGNVREWTEAIDFASELDPDYGRILRGGRFNRIENRLAASYRKKELPTLEALGTGFRVAGLPESECSDTLDNDGDGHVDWNGGAAGEPADPGCADDLDVSEKDESGTYPCDDGIDNEIAPDGLVDFRTDGSGDPGCFNPHWFTESPKCQDGLNNDTGQDGSIDFDGGLSALGYAATGPDPQCVGSPWKNNERCGLGAELAMILPPLFWLFRRRNPLGAT